MLCGDPPKQKRGHLIHFIAQCKVRKCKITGLMCQGKTGTGCIDMYSFTDIGVKLTTHYIV